MAFSPAKWDVQIVGRWNVAILNPAAIQRRLYQKPPNESIILEVPVDGPAPIRVKADGLCVMAGSSRVVIESEQRSMDEVRRAMEIGATLLRWLPETPVSAAGINFRFQSLDAETDLLRQLEQPIDRILSDGGKEIVERSTLRSLRFQDGTLNVHVSQNAENRLEVALNFHKPSTRSTDLIAWLGQDAGRLEAEIEAVCGMMGIRTGQVSDE